MLVALIGARPTTVGLKTQGRRSRADLGGMTGVDRIVIDRTGLEGYYSVVIDSATLPASD